MTRFLSPQRIVVLVALAAALVVPAAGVGATITSPTDGSTVTAKQTTYGWAYGQGEFAGSLFVANYSPIWNGSDFIRRSTRTEWYVTYPAPGTSVVSQPLYAGMQYAAFLPMVVPPAVAAPSPTISYNVPSKVTINNLAIRTSRRREYLRGTWKYSQNSRRYTMTYTLKKGRRTLLSKTKNVLASANTIYRVRPGETPVIFTSVPRGTRATLTVTIKDSNGKVFTGTKAVTF